MNIENYKSFLQRFKQDLVDIKIDVDYLNLKSRGITEIDRLAANLKNKISALNIDLDYLTKIFNYIEGENNEFSN